MIKKITVIIFLLFIYIMTVFSLVKKDNSFSSSENRILQQRPVFTFDSFFKGEYTKVYEKYVQDQFPEREAFVSGKIYTELTMGRTEIKNIIFAEDNYLIEDHKKTEYESETAKKNKEAIISFSDRMVKNLGVSHVSIIIAPTSQSILRDKLPILSNVYNQKEYIDSISENIKKGVFIDVYSALKEHSDEYIYYKTDHHWTTYGAYLAYVKWCETKNIKPNKKEDYKIEKVSDEFLGTIYSKLNILTEKDVIETYSLPDFDGKIDVDMGYKKMETLFDKSYLEQKDKYGVFLGGNKGIITIRQNNKTANNLIIIKDSYGNCFAPLITDKFDNIYIIDLRYFKMNIDKFILENKGTDVMMIYNCQTLTSDVNIGRLK